MTPARPWIGFRDDGADPAVATQRLAHRGEDELGALRFARIRKAHEGRALAQLVVPRFAELRYAADFERTVRQAVIRAREGEDVRLARDEPCRLQRELDTLGAAAAEKRFRVVDGRERGETREQARLDLGRMYVAHPVR